MTSLVQTGAGRAAVAVLIGLLVFMVLPGTSALGWVLAAAGALLAGLAAYTAAGAWVARQRQ